MQSWYYLAHFEDQIVSNLNKQIFLGLTAPSASLKNHTSNEKDGICYWLQGSAEPSQTATTS